MTAIPNAIVHLRRHLWTPVAPVAAAPAPHSGPAAAHASRSPPPAAVQVIGGTEGIGKAIARAAAARGAQVTVVGRTNRVEGTANVSFVRGDLTLMRDAAALGASPQALPTDLDVLVFTNGILAAPKREVRVACVCARLCAVRIWGVGGGAGPASL